MIIKLLLQGKNWKISWTKIYWRRSWIKKRIESPRPKRNRNIAEWTKQDIENSSQEFVDDISVARYCFEPYTLEYFNRYTAIVRNKVNILLSLIEKIGNKDIQPIQELLTELDIVLDENGNVLKVI